LVSRDTVAQKALKVLEAETPLEKSCRLANSQKEHKVGRIMIGVVNDRRQEVHQDM